MLKKCLFLILVLGILCTNICYATPETVTDENLKEAFEKFVSSEINNGEYNITVLNNIITVTVDEESYIMNYVLTDKPTFSIEVPIEKGMSYEEFKKKTDGLALNLLGYIAVANIQGVELDDANTYFFASYLRGVLNGSYSTGNSYTIVDDLTETIEKTDDSKTIYTSEFGDRVIEYVNDMYKEKRTISDSTGINSYLLTIEKLDTTETSCKLVSKLSVNLDADFSKIVGYREQTGGSNEITKENADLVLSLKVGQKCKFESTIKVTGYEFYGSKCIEINDDKTEITAISVGTRSGYLYVGEEKKSIYVTVEENEGNDSLETITLKLDTETEVNPPENNTEEENDKNESNNDNTATDSNLPQKENNNIESNKDNTTSDTKLPQTGKDSYIVMIILSFSIIMIVLRKKLRKF